MTIACDGNKDHTTLKTEIDMGVAPDHTPFVFFY